MRESQFRTNPCELYDPRPARLLAAAEQEMTAVFANTYAHQLQLALQTHGSGELWRQVKPTVAL